jgi:DNA repair protein RecO (recombination protein O)
MHSRIYKSEGILLGRQNYGEADRIIHLFSKDYGKVTLIAKGIRKMKSRKRGHLEVFGKVNFSAIKGKGMDLILEAEQTESFSKIRKSLKKVALAYYFTEIVGRIVREGEPNKAIYEILENYLYKLEDTDTLKKLRFDYVREIVVAAGYWPKGKILENPDLVMEEIIERKPNTLRVGKKLLM